VNGGDFLDLVRAVEQPFANREGRPEMAGQYGPLFMNSISKAPRYFLGEDPRPHRWPGEPHTILYVCRRCDEAACWPLFVEIEVTDTTVTWHDFFQMHRRLESPAGHWTYDKLGPFVFDRSAYELEVEKLNARRIPDDEAWEELQDRIHAQLEVEMERQQGKSTLR
jgi:hypothetical protein